MDDENEHESVNPDSEPPEVGARPRAVWVRVLVVLGAVVLLITATDTWVKRQMLETDRWVTTSEQLLAAEEIRATLAVFLVDELYASVDVAAALEERLPDDLSGLAAPVAAGLRGPAVDVVDRLLASRAAQEIWSRANRRAHETFVAVVRDETRPGISTAEGTVTLELREFVVALAERLGLPESAIARIPEGVGSLVLLESEQLGELQDVVRVIDWAGIALLIVIFGLFATAVALAQGWRRVAIRYVGLAVLIDSLLLLVIQRLARAHVLDNYVAVPANRPAVAQVLLIATALLRDIAWTGVLLGGLTIVATVLVGPGRPAVALRRRLGPTLLANPGATWVGVALVLLVLAAWTPFNIVSTWFGFLTTVGIVVATVVAFRWACERERPRSIMDQDDPGARAAQPRRRTT